MPMHPADAVAGPAVTPENPATPGSPWSQATTLCFGDTGDPDDPGVDPDILPEPEMKRYRSAVLAGGEAAGPGEAAAKRFPSFWRLPIRCISW